MFNKIKNLQSLSCVSLNDQDKCNSGSALKKLKYFYGVYLYVYAVVGVQQADSFIMEVFHQQHDLITFSAIVILQNQQET
jgi:hypothetical protein